MLVNVSVVIPVYNEEENLPLLYAQLRKAFETLRRPWELLFVDDGSGDGSFEVLRDIARHDERVRVIRFRRNYGQTAALQAGLQEATGEIIVMLDADLQNDPADFGLLLEKIDEGYDLVHGWRKDRQDPLLTRRLPSRLANWLISRTTRFPIHDLGCTLKAMRREIAEDLELYGEMHRFIPILAYWRGARCAEVVTRHHPRRYGKSKYGLSRTLRVLLDLITVKFILDYFASPMKLFGMLGVASTAAGLTSGLATVLMKLLQDIHMTGNPLLLLTVLLLMVGVQFFSLGLLGEVSARIYFGSQNKQHYTVRERLNLPANEPKPLRHAA
jgi:glycosyltransferase involved in cell wall biosynthesis